MTVTHLGAALREELTLTVVDLRSYRLILRLRFVEDVLEPRGRASISLVQMYSVCLYSFPVIVFSSAVSCFLLPTNTFILIIDTYYLISLILTSSYTQNG